MPRYVFIGKKKFSFICIDLVHICSNNKIGALSNSLSNFMYMLLIRTLLYNTEIYQLTEDFF